MKKSLLALAVLGAFAGAASAQTNVTIYGKVDAGLQRSSLTYTHPVTDAEVKVKRTAMVSGHNGGSRLGFKGSEDLGGGLSAIFAIENGFTVDDGALAGDLFGRQAWVGVNGGFGAVKLGRQYTPMHLAVDSVDPFGTNLAFGGMGGVFYTGGTRMSNTVTYALPSNLGGFYGQAAYGFGEVAGNSSASSQLGLNAGYANGPINAVVAYHTAKNAADATIARSTLVGGTYDFGVAKAHAAFANNKGIATVPASFAGATDVFSTANFAADFAGVDVNKIKTRDIMVGVSAPVGSVGSVRALVERKDFKEIDGVDVKLDIFAVAYIHNLSKRTHVYASAGRATGEGEEAGAKEKFVKANQFTVGLQHNF